MPTKIAPRLPRRMENLANRRSLQDDSNAVVSRPIPPAKFKRRIGRPAGGVANGYTYG